MGRLTIILYLDFSMRFTIEIFVWLLRKLFVDILYVVDDDVKVSAVYLAYLQHQVANFNEQI